MANTITIFNKKKIIPYLFISPFFIHYAIFGIYPLIYGFWLGLNRQMGMGQYEFIGFDNYIRLFQDERFGKAMTNTIYYTGGSLFIILPLAFFMAILLNSDALKRAKGAVSTAIFTPHVTSVVVIGIIFTYLLKSEGVVNSLLALFNIGPVRFLIDPKWALPSVILLGTWKYLGINTLFFMAGLQNIPLEVKEAARIDCQNNFQKTIYITLPMLKPIMTFIVFQAIVGSFNIFGEPFMLSGGGAGANDSYLFPTVYLYLSGFRSANMTYAASIGYVLTLTIIVFTGAQLFFFREKK